MGDSQLMGYLHVKDVLGLLGKSPDTPVPAGIARPLPDVASTAKLGEAWEHQRRRRVGRSGRGVRRHGARRDPRCRGAAALVTRQELSSSTGGQEHIRLRSP
jgi:hypothetical protein